MTSPSSRRAGVVQGSQLTASGPEPSSGVGPAFHPDEPAPPLRSYLELGALATAVPCARLHARHVLREWGLNGLAPDSELLVSELVTNAVAATAGHGQAAIRLQLSGNSTRVLIEVWDADPRPPAPKDLGQNGTPDPQEERGRGLFLVAALSARWDWYPTREPMGKVVWCEVRALSPALHGAGEGRALPFVRITRPTVMGAAGSVAGGPARARHPRPGELSRQQRTKSWTMGSASAAGGQATPTWLGLTPVTGRLVKMSSARPRFGWRVGLAPGRLAVCQKSQ